MSETILDRVAAQVSSALARHGISQTGTIEREIALAAIFGMKEPSEGMIGEGIIERHQQETPEAWSKATSNIYRAMIEAALIESDRAFDDHKAKIQRENAR